MNNKSKIKCSCFKRFIIILCEPVPSAVIQSLRFSPWLWFFQLSQNLNSVCLRTNQRFSLDSELQKYSTTRLLSVHPCNSITETAPYFITLVKDQRSSLKLSVSLTVPVCQSTALFCVLLSPKDPFVKPFHKNFTPFICINDFIKVPLISQGKMYLLGLKGPKTTGCLLLACYPSSALQFSFLLDNVKLTSHTVWIFGKLGWFMCQIIRILLGPMLSFAGDQTLAQHWLVN